MSVVGINDCRSVATIQQTLKTIQSKLWSAVTVSLHNPTGKLCRSNFVAILGIEMHLPSLHYWSIY